MLRRTLSLLLLLPLLASCTSQEGPVRVSGRVEVDDVRIGSRIGGRVARVHADEGDAVAAGAVIVELDDAEWRAQLDAANASLAQAQADLDLLLAGSREEDIRRAEAIVRAHEAEVALRRKGFRDEEVAEARAQLDSARSSLELARRELERAESLMTSNTIDQRQLDRARSEHETAKAAVDVAAQRVALRESGSRPEEISMAEASLDQARAELLRLQRGARPEEIAARRAAFEAAKANVARIQTQLDETRVLAPTDATVETLDLHPGDLVRAGDGLAVLNMRASPWVRCYVPQVRLGAMKPGQQVTVTVDAYPEASFKGTVRRIASEAEFTPRNVQTHEKRAELVFEVKVDVADERGLLRAGMYADVILPDAR